MRVFVEGRIFLRKRLIRFKSNTTFSLERESDSEDEEEENYNIC